MKFSVRAVAFCAALLQPVAANFDVYMVDVYDAIFKSHTRGWQIFEAQPGSCIDVQNAPVFWDSGDVSYKNGVRCKGSGCGYTPPADNIDQLEMNFSFLNGPVYHWTLYKDRGRTMVGLDGNTYGNCIVFPDGDYDCNSIFGGKEQHHGYRKFRCLTQFTADQINHGK
ncbi:hypothetical protein UCDDA912_g05133 [Diaporthe ampelina]|uniref:Small secreted protein n=1 Tax=Diaporthe ampelina TaxID=1214573 RepID=A0A0G2FKL6_9PEZI|nr:hypothetical protein UCDDA912_g05133 [Diaporthe ampelina]